jgi:branched-chain amino acid transport system substrate-binding protein
MRRGFKYIFRVCVISDNYVPAELELAASLQDKTTGRKVKKIAHLYEDSAYGQGENALMKRDAAKYGLELIHSQAVPGGAADVTPYVNKLKSSNPDFIIAAVFFFDTCNFIRTFKEQDYCPMGYLFGADSDEFLTEMKKDGNYSFTYLNWDETMKASWDRQILVRYKKKFGSNMDGWAAQGYTSVYVLKDALERAASTDRDKLRKALAETDLPAEKGNLLPTKGGRIQFDEKGENKNILTMMGQVLDGKRVIVWPSDYKTGDPVFPVPKWGERK